MQVLRQGLLNLNMHRQQDDQEEEQKKDNSEMDFIATLLDNKTKPGEEIKTIQQEKQSSTIEPEPARNELFDEKEFMKLDKKIREGEATEEEDQQFSQLVPKMAELQGKDYQKTPEEEEKLL